jgi:hypothetical protein
MVHYMVIVIVIAMDTKLIGEGLVDTATANANARTVPRMQYAICNIDKS